MFSFRKALGLAVLLSVAACGTTIDYMPINAPPRAMAPRAPESVEIFTDARPEKPFVDVGILEAQQQSSASQDNAATVLQKLRQAAADRGCDAVVLDGSNDKVVGDRTGTTTLKGYRATCIVYR